MCSVGEDSNSIRHPPFKWGSPLLWLIRGGVAARIGHLRWVYLNRVSLESDVGAGAKRFSELLSVCDSCRICRLLGFPNHVWEPFGLARGDLEWSGSLRAGCFGRGRK